MTQIYAINDTNPVRRSDPKSHMVFAPQNANLPTKKDDFFTNLGSKIVNFYHFFGAKIDAFFEISKQFVQILCFDEAVCPNIVFGRGPFVKSTNYFWC